jgi:hypothetical protein
MTAPCAPGGQRPIDQHLGHQSLHLRHQHLGLFRGADLRPGGWCCRQGWSASTWSPSLSAPFFLTRRTCCARLWISSPRDPPFSIPSWPAHQGSLATRRARQTPPGLRAGRVPSSAPLRQAPGAVGLVAAVRSAARRQRKRALSACLSGLHGVWWVYDLRRRGTCLVSGGVQRGCPAPTPNRAITT